MNLKRNETIQAHPRTPTLTVLAKRRNTSEPYRTATYANRTQAQAAADRIGCGAYVIQGAGRPLLVVVPEFQYVLHVRRWREGRNVHSSTNCATKAELYATLGTEYAAGGVEGWYANVQRYGKAHGSLAPEFTEGAEWSTARPEGK